MVGGAGGAKVLTMMRAPDPEYQEVVDRWRALCLKNHSSLSCGDCLMGMAEEIYYMTQERKRESGFAYFLTRKSS